VLRKRTHARTRVLERAGVCVYVYVYVCVHVYACECW